MISSNLYGGLGNQMFIYAMVRALSLRNNIPYVFNSRTGFLQDKEFGRCLELSYLNLSLPENSLRTFDYNNFGNSVRRISSKLGRNIIFPIDMYIKEETPMHFQKEFVHNPLKNAYLEGYWQSPLYFEDYEYEIRKEFQIKSMIDDNVKDELASWRSLDRPIVMIGVRRYQECKKSSALTENVCDKKYYNNAIVYMKQKLDSPLFIVFSQDQEWCRANIEIGDGIFVKPKKGSLATIEDLYLMTNCDHAIISNSSFYWWGAWLQNFKYEHFVIAPNTFINKDCVCKDWITFDNKKR